MRLTGGAYDPPAAGVDDSVGAPARRVADLFEQLVPEREQRRSQALRDDLVVLADDAMTVSAEGVAAVQEAARRHRRHVDLVLDGPTTCTSAGARWSSASARRAPLTTSGR